MAARRVRWECPNGCAGVLGPSRPRRDNIVRYCLECSAEIGKLVERVSPAIERRRAAGAERAAAKRKAKAERETKRWTIDGIDTRKLMRSCLRLKPLRLGNGKAMGEPELVLVRHADYPRSQLGRAHGGWQVRINTYPHHSRWDLVETMIHELVHIYGHRTGRFDNHDRGFRDKHDEAIAAAFPGIKYPFRRAGYAQWAEIACAIKRWADANGVDEPRPGTKVETT